MAYHIAGSNVVIDPYGDWFPERGVCGAGVAVLEGNNVMVEDMLVHHIYSWCVVQKRTFEPREGTDGLP